MAGPLSGVGGVGQQPIQVQQNTDSAAAREPLRPGDDQSRQGIETQAVAALQAQDTDTEDSSLVDRRDEIAARAAEEQSGITENQLEATRGSVVDVLV